MKLVKFLAEFPVDAGMIGIIPLAAVTRKDGLVETCGAVVRVQANRSLSLQYDDGKILIKSGVTISERFVFVAEDTDFWIGDVGYALVNNIPVDDRNWYEATDPEPGYWAACVRSSETPRGGFIVHRPFQLPGGMQGLVSQTKWGDGLYPGRVEDEGGYLDYVEIKTAR